MNDNKQIFENLTTNLETPLKTRATEIEELRQQIALAESYGIVVSQYVRTLLRLVAERKAEVLDSLKNGFMVSDGTPDLDGKEDERAAEFAKLKVDEKTIIIDSYTAELDARLAFAQQLEVLIKRRCSLGQSFLSSHRNEQYVN